MELRIQGHFSYIDKFQKLKFTYIDETTFEKLDRHCSVDNPTAFPYTIEDFTVVMPRTMKYIPQDVKKCVGLDCMLRIKLQPYSFISKLENNLGDKVEGFQLVLIDIGC